MRFIMGRLLLLLLLASLSTIGSAVFGSASICNVRELEVDTSLTINVNCSRFDPTYNYVLDEEFEYAGHTSTNRYAIQYTCRTNSSHIDTTDGMIETDLVSQPFYDPNFVAPTPTLSHTFTTGDECTFSGCYCYVSSGAIITRAIRPTPCVIDLNECISGANDCDKHAECINTIGSFKCLCMTGYTGSGTHCQDINECVTEAHNCSENAACMNTDGDYNCSCNLNYEGDGFNCTDIDECVTEVHNCSENADCMNTDGGYNCYCTLGFEGNAFNCSDIDECAIDTHNCSENAACMNTDGDYNCSCNLNYEGDGFNCTDIDECVTEVHNCSELENADCMNMDGGYNCSCTLGFKGDAFNCSDIDECAIDAHNCSENAACMNTDGDYNCSCNPNYEGDGFNCTVINECTPGLDNCSAIDNSFCENVEGSFSCACRVGFRWNESLCLNVDECAERIHNCSSHASCSDRDGDYSCRCIAGYHGNGFNCRIGPVVGLLGIGAPMAIILTIFAAVLACCIIHRRKKREINQLFFKYKDELNPNFAPVNFEVSTVKLSTSPSVVSTFDALEKWSDEETLESCTTNGTDDENTNSPLESVPSVESKLLHPSADPITPEKEDTSMHPRFSAVLDPDSGLSKVSSVSSGSDLFQSSPPAPPQYSDYLEQRAASGEEAYVRHLSGEQNESLCRGTLSPNAYVLQLLPTTAALNLAASTTTEKDSRLPERQHGIAQSQLTTSEELLPTTVVQNIIAPNKEESRVVGKVECSVVEHGTYQTDSCVSEEPPTPDYLQQSLPMTFSQEDEYIASENIRTRRRIADSVSSGYVTCSDFLDSNEDCVFQLSNQFTKHTSRYLRDRTANRLQSSGSGYISTSENIQP